MITGRALSTAPISSRSVEYDSGLDTVTLLLHGSDGGFTTIGLSSENGTISISSLEGVTTVTTLNADSSTLEITSVDSGVTTIIDSDVVSISITSSDVGSTYVFGSDALTINLTTSEGNQILLGADSATLTIDGLDQGYQIVTGVDSNTVFLEVQDVGYTVFYDANAGNTTLTWVLNLLRGGHSQYSNYLFNSYFRLGDFYYGCNSDGVHKLTGGLDITVPIAATATTGVVDFGVNTYVADAYTLLRSDGDMSLTTTTEETRQPDPYAIPFNNHSGLQRRRVKLSKNINGNTWSFSITNESGGDFTLKQLEIMPLKSKRRI